MEHRPIKRVKDYGSGSYLNDTHICGASERPKKKEGLKRLKFGHAFDLIFSAVILLFSLLIIGGVLYGVYQLIK